MNLCQMVNLADWLKTNNLWEEILSAGQGELPYLDALTADELNYYTTLNYGNRWVFSKYHDADLPLLAKMIVLMNKEIWDNVLDFNKLAANFGATQSFQGKEVTTTDSTTDDTANETNKVSGYNSANMVDDSGKTSDDNRKFNEVVTRDRDNAQFSIKAGYENLPLLAKLNIINRVISDVVNSITDSIY